MDKYDYHFVVVGGGTIGLPTALWLAKKIKKSVLCLEAGPNNQTLECFFGTTDNTNFYYKGAKDGRRFGVGGTSSVWGGALSPFLPADCKDDWTIKTLDLEQHFEKISQLFKIKHKPSWLYEYEVSHKAEYIKRFAYWPSFKNRNVYTILKNEINAQKNLSLQCDSPVVSIRSYKEYNEIDIFYKNSKQVITCKNLIICAGAIESTRLSLLINNHSKDVRAGFSDHLSAPFGYISDCNFDALNKFSSFEFLKDKSMRTWRFEMSSASKLRNLYPPHNVDIKFSSVDDSKLNGFQSIRLILQAIQKRKIPSLTSVVGLIKNLRWIFKMLYWMIFRKRLLRPDKSIPEIHLVIEQEISEKNYIRLSETKVDQFGVPSVEINWGMTQTDVKNISSVIYEFERFWIENLEADYGKLNLYEMNQTLSSFEHCGGIFHPTSALAFGDNKKYLLNKDLFLKSANNIQFLSTACLPKGGGVNPTMMALLLAARLVDQHAAN